MATVLHIRATATPELSYSLRAAEAFLESYLTSHPGETVGTMNVAEEAVPEFLGLTARGKYRILRGESHTREEAEAWKGVEAEIERFKKADKLVISSPMWNFGIPYRLKQYFDVIVQPGYTFAYSPEKGYTGLVTGRPAMLILARGGEYRAGTDSAAFDFQRPYLESILGFIGFTEIGTIIVEPTLQGGPELAEQRLAETIVAAREKARTF
ncbi:NAD(P)H-dependent oxidoreductase [bacterium]|nr:NAD(P)H-dependent oxidoreductase [bacterium]